MWKSISGHLRVCVLPGWYALAATDGSTEYSVSRRLVNAAGMNYIAIAIRSTEALLRAC